MDTKEIPPVSSLYWWTNEEKGVNGPPLDFSFMKAASLDDLENKNLQATRTGRIPKRTQENRYLTSSLWLRHNSITSTTKLQNFVKNTLVSSENLSWLDLSFNSISNIGNEISELPNLKILYLHGNNISNMNSILKLRKLLKLRTLTLHGNPLESLANYRSYIVNILPKLLNLDFSPVISAEKKKALPPGFFKIINTSG